ncbi:MAG: outer membrane protein assembly factor BamE [Methylococcales bacterium]|nr:outer membrane protein assembly factor BamE [Methylococcales bacterium]
MRVLSDFCRPVGLCLVLLAGVHTLSGCATVGKEFPAGRITELKIGTTTINDVQAIFGPPWRVGNENGAKTWSYGRYLYRVFGDPSTQDLVIRFDSSGIVRSYNFNTTANK